MGTVLADLENLPSRPLDRIRNLQMKWKIPLNCILVLTFFYYGIQSYTFTQINVAGMSIILLALTSEGFQWFLFTPPLLLLGRISFSLYLFHELFVFWTVQLTYIFLLSHGLSPNASALVTWLIWTPILIFVSWGLTILIDEPRTFPKN